MERLLIFRFIERSFGLVFNISNFDVKLEFMNSETFIEFLKTPAQLHRVSYEELKTLVVQYPFCQNLRFLLLKKSQIEKHPDFERNLQMAAAYCVDRSWLYEQLYSDDLITENTDNLIKEGTSGVLELKDLTEEAGTETLDLGEKEEILLADTEDTLVVEATGPATAINITDLSEEAGASGVSSEPDFSEEKEFDTDLLDEILAEAEGHQISEVSEEVEVLNEEETLSLSEEAEIEEPESGVSPDDIEALFSLEDDDEEIDFEAERAVDEETHSIASVSADEVDFVESENEIIFDLTSPEDQGENTQETEIIKVQEPEEEEIELEMETEAVAADSSFSNWLKQFNSNQIMVEIEDLDTIEKKKVNYKYELIDGEWRQIKIKAKKKKKKSEAEQIAAKSVKLSNEIASETLARLLEKQGYFRKAVKMYERLSLENPQKSDFFAAQIEKLNKLIDS